MFTIYCKYENFPPPPTAYPSLSSTSTEQLNSNWEELIWAAITIGRKEWDHIIQHGEHSLYEMIYRLSIIRANFMTVDSRLIKTPAFNALDPSEKSAVSYFTGLMLSKLMATRKFYVPWLMHLEVYANDYSLYYLPGNQRPDLIGLNLNNEWMVAEAKGRTGSCDRATIDRAKGQSQMIETINGQNPFLQVAVIAHFSGSNLSVLLNDPEEPNENAIKLEIETADFIKKYYRSFIQLLIEGDSETVIEEVFITRYLRQVDLTIGLYRPIFDALAKTGKNEDNSLSFISKLLRSDSQNTNQVPFVPRFGINIENRDGFIGTDGVYVKLGSSWTN